MGKMATNVDQTQERATPEDRPVNIEDEEAGMVEEDGGVDDDWSTDIVDALCSTDLSSLRESLLEKILNQKKMELMRSPEVMSWIAQRQADMRNQSNLGLSTPRHSHSSIVSTTSQSTHPSFTPSPQRPIKSLQDTVGTGMEQFNQGHPGDETRENQNKTNRSQEHHGGEFWKHSDCDDYRSEERKLSNTRRTASGDSRIHDRTFLEK